MSRDCHDGAPSAGADGARSGNLRSDNLEGHISQAPHEVSPDAGAPFSERPQLSRSSSPSLAAEDSTDTNLPLTPLTIPLIEGQDATRGSWLDPNSHNFIPLPRGGLVRMLAPRGSHIGLAADASSPIAPGTDAANSVSHPGPSYSLLNLHQNRGPNASATLNTASTTVNNVTVPAYIQSSSMDSVRNSINFPQNFLKLKDSTADVAEKENYAHERRIIMRNPLKGSDCAACSNSSLDTFCAQREVYAAVTQGLPDNYDEGNCLDAEIFVDTHEPGPHLLPHEDGILRSERSYSIGDRHHLTSDDESSWQGRRGSRVRCTLSSLPAVAFIMCMGAIIVGLLGFLPFYFTGVASNSRTTDFLLSEAMTGVASITQNSLAMLPAFVHIVTFNYVKRVNTTVRESNLPSHSDQLLLSLLTVLTRFKASIFYIRFIYEGGLFTNTGYTTDLQVYGGASDTAVKVPMRKVYPENVSFVEPAKTLGYYDFHQAMYSPDFAMQQIAVKWVENSSFSKRWLLAPDNGTSTYFNFVMPFIMNGTVGFCEAGTASDKIIKETTTLAKYLRGHGRIFLVDVVHDILVGNSWNQPAQTVRVDPTTGTTLIIPTSVEDINEPIIRAAMHIVKERGGVKAVLHHNATALINFRFSGNTASLNLTRVTDIYGLDLLLGVVVVRSDFERAFATARTAVITVTVLVVVFAGVVAVVIAWFVVREMKRLIPQLIRASNLDVSHGDDRDHHVHGWLAYITEIRGIHEAFVRVERSLREMPTFVPAAVMMAAPLDGSHSDSDGSDGKTHRARTRFNANIVKDSTNVFAPMDVAMVLVDVHRGLNTEEAFQMMDIISQCAEKNSGYIESINSGSFFVNFGAQSQNPLVVPNICKFALTTYNETPEHLRNYVVCLAARMIFLVGTCGARHSKARVVFNTQRMLDISKVLWDIGCHVASTSDTLSHFASGSTQIEWYHIDCVRFPDEVSLVTLCELRDPKSKLAEKGDMSKMMGDGLSRMCKGEYQAAMMIFDSTDSDNVQLKRLRQICVDRVAAGDTSKYIHLIEDFYSVDASIGAYLTGGVMDGDGAPRPDPDLLSRAGSMRHRVGGRALGEAYGDASEAACSFRKHASTIAPLSPPPPVTRSKSEVLSVFQRGSVSARASESAPALPAVEGGEFAEPVRLTERAVAAAMEPRGSPSGCAETGEGRPVQPALPSQTMGHSGMTIASSDDRIPSCVSVDGDSSDAPAFLTGAFEYDPSVISGDGVGSTMQGMDEPQVLRDVNGHEWQMSLFPIGRGALSAIYLGMSDDGVQVAIKRIPRRHRHIKEEELVSEVCTCAKLRHPNIVPYISCCVSQTHLAIIMEYMPGGSLHDIIENFGKLPRTVVRRFMLDIVNGLAYLHESTTHGDVKPHNILLGVDGVCKLSDFGSASDKLTEVGCLNEDRLLRGTAVYISPEGARNLTLTSASDIYSLGVSFLEMVLGRLPWKWADLTRNDPLPLHYQHEFVQCLIAKAIVIDIPDTLDNDMRELALASCAEDPARRPTAQELLSFPFLI